MKYQELPKYRCHKEVHALKIKSIEEESNGGAIIIPHNDPADVAGNGGYEYPSYPVDSRFLNKHNPEPGGYYVFYADGYKSYSPAEAFETGYTRI